MTLRIATIVGARPQFVKAGALSRAIAAEPRLDEFLIHTGQHFDDAMSDVFFRELEIPTPRYNLGIGSQTHGAMTGRMLEGIEAILIDERPDLVIVYGDTNSTTAGALAAAKLNIPIAHVEAGLRSFNRRMPEELNRIVTDHLSTLQFCPTTTSVRNLAAEGITGNVFHSGDVMYDATRFAIARADRHSDIRTHLGLADRDYSVCTIHRAETTDDPDRLRAVVAYLAGIAREHALVIPIHPRTKAVLARETLDLSPAIVTSPLGYFDLHALLAGATGVYTDSGGLQKEAYFHGKPCVTLRDETEWSELIDHGWNRLWQGPDYLPRQPISEYGTGQAAEAMVAEIVRHFRL